MMKFDEDQERGVTRIGMVPFRDETGKVFGKRYVIWVSAKMIAHLGWLEIEQIPLYRGEYKPYFDDHGQDYIVAIGVASELLEGIIPGQKGRPISELLIGYAELVDLGEHFALSIDDRVLDLLSWSVGNVVNVEMMPNQIVAIERIHNDRTEGKGLGANEDLARQIK